jgi:hypothetical protein
MSEKIEKIRHMSHFELEKLEDQKIDSLKNKEIKKENTMKSEIKEFLFKKFSREKKEEIFLNNITSNKERYMTPFVSLTAVYNFKIRTYKRMLIFFIVFFFIIIFFQEYRIRKALSSTLNKDWLVIPGASQFMRVRPGEVSDEVLFSFSDFFIKNIYSFDFLNVEYQYRDLMTYMTPEMRAKFNFENQSKIKKFEKMGVIQYASFDKPSKISQKKKKNGNDVYYEVTYRGTIYRYTHDQKLDPIQEIVTLKFQTSSLENTNRKFFFEVIDIERKNSEIDFEKNEGKIGG